MGTPARADFEAFVEHVGPRLRQALIAAYGAEVGAATTAGALADARDRWERTKTMDDPGGYLFRIAQRRSWWYRRRRLRLPEVPDAATPWIEPQLPKVLRSLPRRQRISVVLCHGYGWTRAEVAELLNITASTVQRHVDRAIGKLLSSLGGGEVTQMRDIRDQLAAYSELLDQAAPGLEELAPAAAPRPGWHRRRAGWTVGAVAIGVLVVSGGLAVVSRRSSTSVLPAESSTTITATAAAPITRDVLNPQAVTTEMFPNWEYRFAGPGAVTVVDGTYHMLSPAYGNGLATVAYAVSNDGVVWSQGSNQPVLDLSEAPWAPREFDQATPRSLVVDAGGTWQLFFEIAWFDEGTDRFRANIGRVVAAQPGGPWSYDSEPVLRPDQDRPWMANRVASPSVVATEDGLIMLFVGGNSGGGVVGLAQSTDGLAWDVRPGPVFAASEDWAGDSISTVDLVVAPGGYTMFYTGDTPSRIGLAVSTELLDWAPHPENPLITALDVPRTSIFDSEFVVAGSAVLGFIENGGVRTDREVVVLRVNVDLETVILALTGG